MKSRVILEDIPSRGKFHSAVFTTYSFNFYYFEQQVLPLMRKKGVHYISVLVDGVMLDQQLEDYSLKSDAAKRNYSVHGVNCKGAFHPKLIFLAGDNDVLLLVGSGNLTLSGHGKNLETWNAIFVDSVSHPMLGIIKESWDYLKSLHQDLGKSAQLKIKTLEQNCSILKNIDTAKIALAYPSPDDGQISWLSTMNNQSIFHQLKARINDDIEEITLMCPYYDKAGKLIQLLDEAFQPEKINIILQEKFGAPPIQLEVADHMHIHDWNHVNETGTPQPFFHAKNIIFKSQNNSYLLTGSANASLMAFNPFNKESSNQEAVLLYQDNKKDFHQLLGLKLGKSDRTLQDFEIIQHPDDIAESNTNSNRQKVFIHAIEKDVRTISLYIDGNEIPSDAKIILCHDEGVVTFEIPEKNKDGYYNVQLIDSRIHFLYGALISDHELISNKQFVINVTAFDRTDPSPSNQTINKIKHAIESGNFSYGKMIDFLNTIHKQRESNIQQTTRSQEKNTSYPKWENEAFFDLKSDEIKERLSEQEIHIASKHYTEYSTVRVWESILMYLKGNKIHREKQSDDDSEDEDSNADKGEMDNSTVRVRKRISQSNFNRGQKKMVKFLDNYLKILDTKIQDKHSNPPNLADLSMLLIIFEIMIQLVSYTEIVDVDGQEKEFHLLPLNFSVQHVSWSFYILKIIGKFHTWINTSGGFLEMPTPDYSTKLDAYKRFAFNSSITLLGVYDAVNYSINERTATTFKKWKQVLLMNVYKSFIPHEQQNITLNEYQEYLPEDIMEHLDIQLLKANAIKDIQYIHQHYRTTYPVTLGGYYQLPNQRILIVEKITVSSSKPGLQFLKLYHPADTWDEKIKDFWNGCMLNTQTMVWIKARK